MPNCPYCETSIERGFFCKKCLRQVKCKNCSDLLDVDSDGCVMCGTLVGQGDVKEIPIDNVTNSLIQPINTFEFRETRNERTAKATLTNDSVDSLRETLSLVVSSYPLSTIVRKNNSNQTELIGNLISGTPEDFDLEKEKNITPKRIPPVGNETTEKLKRLFFVDENKLILEVQDLKATGPKEFGVRLVYLRLLYSKEVEGKEFISRDDLNDTLKEVMGLLDPNIVNWVSTNNDLGLKEDGEKTLIRLKADGYTKALKVLEEVYNEELKGTFSPDKKSRHSSKSSSKSDAPESSAKSSGKGRKKSKDADEWINKWKELNLNIDLHGIAKGLSQIDKVLLALWVINKSTTGVIDAARTTKISPIITNLFFASGSRQNLDVALKNGYKDHLQKTPDGWRITPVGIKRAESLTGALPAESKTKGKK